ncbi:Uncharacterized protein APZ42_012960 [Daphnia magna]|uniref:Uncharacterized protein n=1 Tax=Daphnia magna TaxID=35525 RepID=A0A0P5D439_9CRUS|nr:Uncharacterized protein APZ42_012960 [Daphnia magna]
MCGWLVIRATDSDPRIPSTKKPEKCLYSLLAIVRTEGGPMYTDTHTHMRIFTYTNTENQTTI